MACRHLEHEFLKPLQDINTTKRMEAFKQPHPFHLYTY